MIVIHTIFQLIHTHSTTYPHHFNTHRKGRGKALIRISESRFSHALYPLARRRLVAVGLVSVVAEVVGELALAAGIAPGILVTYLY